MWGTKNRTSWLMLIFFLVKLTTSTSSVYGMTEIEEDLRGNISVPSTISADVLPNEIWIPILKYIDLEDLDHVSRVSKRFYELASDEEVWCERVNSDKIIPGHGNLLTPKNNPEIKSYKAYYRLITSVQIAIPYNLRGLSHRLLPFLDKAFLEGSGYKDYFLGLLCDIETHSEEKWGYYLRADNKGCIRAQPIVAGALYYGWGELRKRPNAERYQDLVRRANQGQKRAQECVAYALSHGELDQSKRPTKERYEELEKRANQGEEKAQECLSDSLSSSSWVELSSEERYQKLLERANRGEEYAQRLIAEALYKGYLEWGRADATLRYQMLLERANLGDKQAQYRVAEILYNGNFAFQWRRPESERYQELALRADKGEIHAQELIAKALYTGFLGCNRYREKVRYEELYRRAGTGDKRAQYWRTEAIYSGRLGQGKRLLEERYNELLRYAYHGETKAQYCILKALARGEFGQKSRSEENRYEEFFTKAHQWDCGAYNQTRLADELRYAYLKPKTKEQAIKRAIRGEIVPQLYVAKAFKPDPVIAERPLLEPEKYFEFLNILLNKIHS